jgi:hypothetical protein
MNLKDHLVTHLNLSHNKFGEKSGLIMGKWIGKQNKNKLFALIS